MADQTEIEEEWEAHICKHGDIDMTCNECWYEFYHRNDPVYPKFSVGEWVWIAPNRSDIAFEAYTLMYVKEVKPFKNRADKDTFLYTLAFEYSENGNTGLTDLEERYLEKAVNF